MLDILAIIAPLFVAMAAGFVAVRMGAYNKADIRVLGRFVIQLALPALLFKALSERSFGEIINLDYLGAYALGSLITFAIAAAGARFLKGVSRPALGLIALGASTSNSGFIGFPLVVQFLGPKATIAIALCMLVENLVMMPLGIALAESSHQDGHSRIRTLLTLFSGLLRNPLIIAILAGFTCSLLQIHFPAPVTRVIDMFALASGAVALFVIGGTLVGLRPGGDLPRVLWVCSGKLIIHPLAVTAMMMLFAPIDPVLRTAGIVVASVPMLSIFPILAQKYDEQSWCASGLLIATIASFATLTIVMWMTGAP
ncbi:MAG: AEC family transporter [Castellaniella sp.]|uniref:AEC family transporter n=1 Tax=Castellaniella sp. TaxID=1955812 RepID=UPI0011F68BA9|nr:AEC family transporter [Castellaniella sp.]TAN26673.1 MAG: AEC family transporter [Castellaniella sp.]